MYALTRVLSLCSAYLGEVVAEIHPVNQSQGKFFHFFVDELSPFAVFLIEGDQFVFDVASSRLVTQIERDELVKPEEVLPTVVSFLAPISYSFSVGVKRLFEGVVR